MAKNNTKTPVSRSEKMVVPMPNTRNLIALAILTHHTGASTLPWNPRPRVYKDRAKEASRKACRGKVDY